MSLRVDVAGFKTAPNHSLITRSCIVLPHPLVWVTKQLVWDHVSRGHCVVSLFVTTESSQLRVEVCGYRAEGKEKRGREKTAFAASPSGIGCPQTRYRCRLFVSLVL